MARIIGVDLGKQGAFAVLETEALDAQIAPLTDVRNRLDGCIGCGCLSLKKCALYNAGDKVAATGNGPRYLLGETPSG